MATPDLFVWINALYTKEKPEGTPPIYVMHRFLASDRDLAPAARYLQQDIRKDPGLVFATWQALLPRGGAAPRGLTYIAAKKPPEAEDLTERMMQVLGERRSVVEQMQELFALAGQSKELHHHFGFEYSGDPPPATGRKGKTPIGQKKKGGLLDS